MTCRRAYEIDIAAYLADPRAAEHADFRAHWPACAACSAEVRAWTELSARLAAGAAPAHPEPALLLRYDEAPNRLDPAQHAALRAHLAGCGACRDELAGLRTFEPALAAARTALETTTAWEPARPSVRTGLAAMLRALLWQPAFAYAAAFAVAGPLIYLQVTQDRIDLRPQPRSEPARPAAAPVPAPAPSIVAAPEPTRPAPAAPAKEERALRPKAEPAPRPEPRPDAERSPGMGAGAAAPQPKAPSPRTEPVAERAPAPSEALVPAPPPSEASASAPEAASEGAGHDAPAARPRSGRVRRYIDTQRLLGNLAAEEGAAVARLELRSDAGGEFVSVPLDSEGGENEVRIESPDGAKRRVERYAAGAAVAQLRLAQGWLGAGRHRIVVRSDRGEREYYVER